MSNIWILGLCSQNKSVLCSVKDIFYTVQEKSLHNPPESITNFLLTSRTVFMNSDVNLFKETHLLRICILIFCFACFVLFLMDNNWWIWALFLRSPVLTHMNLRNVSFCIETHHLMSECSIEKWRMSGRAPAHTQTGKQKYVLLPSNPANWTSSMLQKVQRENTAAVLLMCCLMTRVPCTNGYTTILNQMLRPGESQSQTAWSKIRAFFIP